MLPCRRQIGKRSGTVVACFQTRGAAVFSWACICSLMLGLRSAFVVNVSFQIQAHAVCWQCICALCSSACCVTHPFTHATAHSVPLPGISWNKALSKRHVIRLLLHAIIYWKSSYPCRTTNIRLGRSSACTPSIYQQRLRRPGFHILNPISCFTCCLCCRNVKQYCIITAWAWVPTLL